MRSLLSKLLDVITVQRKLLLVAIKHSPIRLAGAVLLLVLSPVLLISAIVLAVKISAAALSGGSLFPQATGIWAEGLAPLSGGLVLLVFLVSATFRYYGNFAIQSISQEIECQRFGGWLISNELNKSVIKRHTSTAAHRLKILRRSFKELSVFLTALIMLFACNVLLILIDVRIFLLFSLLMVLSGVLFSIASSVARQRRKQFTAQVAGAVSARKTFIAKRLSASGKKQAYRRLTGYLKNESELHSKKSLLSEWPAIMNTVLLGLVLSVFVFIFSAEDLQFPTDPANLIVIVFAVRYSFSSLSSITSSSSSLADNYSVLHYVLSHDDAELVI